MTTEKEQLEAEIAERDARIAGLVGVRDHLRLQASIQAQEARTQKAIVAEIGAIVGEPCDWLTASAVREALKAQQPSGVGGEREAPYSSGVAESLERTDWTPEQALRWYAEGRHFDTVHGRTRIIDTGAIASNALKHASLKYIELKGDAELTELREKVAISLVCGGVVMPERMQYVRYFRGVVPENRLEAEAHTDGWNSCLDEVARLNPCRAQAVPEGYVLVPVEPTLEMMKASKRELEKSPVIWCRYKAAYRALLAAAPSASADAVSVPVELLERTIMNLLYGSARDNAKELRTLLARSESEVKP